jgi:Na+/proline symporter
MLLIIIIIFALITYTTSELLGSPAAVFDLLVKAAADHPVSGNSGGSYLTMRSAEGVVFFIIKYSTFLLSFNWIANCLIVLLATSGPYFVIM